MVRYLPLIAALALSVGAGPTAGAAAPVVTITDGGWFDRPCSILRWSTIEPAWKQELDVLLPAFRDVWQRNGAPLLAKVEELTGKRFAERSVNARLTLCDIPSNSYLLGISVNMRHALASFTPTPVPLRYKANVLAHEVLHKFLLDHPVSGSALRDQHAGETEAVRDHLHLLALMKAAFLELGEASALEEMVRIDGLLPGGTYRRAWELVNRTPDEYRLYVDEVRRSG